MNSKIADAAKITRPFQLLAAWLMGMFFTAGLFLHYSTKNYSFKWIQPLLIFAAIMTIPGFLYLIFKMQTKYRPEMQTDEFYNPYLS